MHSESPAGGELRAHGPPEAKAGGPDHGHELSRAVSRERNLVVSPDADDLLDEIVLLEDVAPEARHDDLQIGARVVDGESEGLKDPHGILSRRADGDEPLHSGQPECDSRARPRRRIDVEHPARHSTAAEIGHELGGPPECLAQAFDIAATLEPVRGIRGETERARRATNGTRIPVRRFEQHGVRPVGHLGLRAPHHTADRERPLGIADQGHVGREGPLLPVQGSDPLTGMRATHDDRVLGDGVVVEGVERLPELPHHVVGDVHEVVDRAKPDRAQPLREPRRRWARRSAR